MSRLDWIVYTSLLTLYIMCLFTVCRLTFAKGRTVLGIVGIFLPFLWLIAAILPAKEGSQYDIAMKTASQQHLAAYSS
jgi:hypothetical protein